MRFSPITRGSGAFPTKGILRPDRYQNPTLPAAPQRLLPLFAPILWVVALPEASFLVRAFYPAGGLVFSVPSFKVTPSHPRRHFPLDRCPTPVSVDFPPLRRYRVFADFPTSVKESREKPIERKSHGTKRGVIIGGRLPAHRSERQLLTRNWVKSRADRALHEEVRCFPRNLGRGARKCLLMFACERSSTRRASSIRHHLRRPLDVYRFDQLLRITARRFVTTLSPPVRPRSPTLCDQYCVQFSSARPWDPAGRRTRCIRPFKARKVHSSRRVSPTRTNVRKINLFILFSVSFSVRVFRTGRRNQSHRVRDRTIITETNVNN